MEKQNLQNNLRSGFKVPNNYFETFEDVLFNKSSMKNSTLQSSKPGYIVPENYFETVEEKIFSQINHNQPKVISMYSKNWMRYAAGIAASMLILFTIVFKNNTTLDIGNIETAAIESYIQNIDLSTLDLSQLITDEELNNTMATSTLYNEDYIESYLLNHADVEYLLND